jgi:hypothetical protein
MSPDPATKIRFTGIDAAPFFLFSDDVEYAVPLS